jgi:lipopolysaccharide export system ATP-binding protein
VEIHLARDENVTMAKQAPRKAPRRAEIPQKASKPQNPVEPERPGLVVEGLRKSYKRRPVVRDVSLSVRRGEAVGLLGPNGAGKTTVFYMITGLIAADSGRISLDGTDITHLPMYRRARLGIGYLAQESSIFRGLTVEENIRAVLELTESSKQKRDSKLRELLDEFSITHLRHSPAVALSGGERRRVEIARALAADPEFMLLDEPFAGIDPIAISDIRNLVRQLTARGIGVLVTDHNVRETLELIDRAFIIHEGHVLTEGTPDEIVRNADVRRYYLGADFSL